MQIDQTTFPGGMKIIGFAKTDKVIKHEDINGNSFDLQPGLYPIIYFEIYSVQIAVQGQYDFIYISRDDCEWINISPDMITAQTQGEDDIEVVEIDISKE